jgi:amino acid permease
VSSAPRFQMKPLTWLLLAVAVVFVILAVVYFVTPANQLPSVLPGHAAHVTRHHTKHGIAMLGLAVLACIGAWFTTAPARSAA